MDCVLRAVNHSENGISVSVSTTIHELYFCFDALLLLLLSNAIKVSVGEYICRKNGNSKVSNIFVLFYVEFGVCIYDSSICRLCFLWHKQRDNQSVRQNKNKRLSFFFYSFLFFVLLCCSSFIWSTRWTMFWGMQLVISVQDNVHLFITVDKKEIGCNSLRTVWLSPKREKNWEKSYL